LLNNKKGDEKANYDNYFLGPVGFLSKQSCLNFDFSFAFKDSGVVPAPFVKAQDMLRQPFVVSDFE